MAESLVLHLLIKKLLKPDQALRDSAVLGVVGKLFDYVTPMATGGQPVQVWRMSRQGISVGGATSVLLLRFISFQLVTSVLSLMALALALTFLVELSWVLGR